MTEDELRDQIAITAMGALLRDNIGVTAIVLQSIAKEAYAAAYHMLAEREKWLEPEE